MPKKLKAKDRNKLPDPRPIVCHRCGNGQGTLIKNKKGEPEHGGNIVAIGWCNRLQNERNLAILQKNK